MKSSILLQSLVLMGAVATVLHAASIAGHPSISTLLEFIKDNAMPKKYSKDELSEMVVDPSLGAVKCPKCFLLGAEKSLKMTHFNESMLYVYLHKYNKLTNCTSYHLNKEKTCTLQELLTNIRQCVRLI